MTTTGTSTLPAGKTTSRRPALDATIRLLRQGSDLLRAASDRRIIAGLTVLALILRAPYLQRAYWVDEGISLGIASHPLKDLPKLLREDGSPPLFYAILHFWIRLFGTAEPEVHALPLLISLVAIPVGYWSGREISGRRAGLALAALMATNPFLAWYATEARMYSLVVLLAEVALTLAWRAFRDGARKDAVGAVTAFALLVYTHDWGVYLVVATAAVLLGLAVDRNDHLRIRWVIGGGFAVLVLWLPWLPSFLYQAGNTAAPWAVRPAIGDFFADPSTAIGGTIGFIIAPLLGVGAILLRRRSSPAQRMSGGVMAAVGIGTTIVGFVGAMLEPSWTVRYLAVVVAPFLIAAAVVLAGSAAGRRVVAAACALLAGWSLVGLVLPNPAARYAKSNVAALASAVRSRLQPGDVVLVTQTEQTAVAWHYLPPGLRYVNPTGPVSDPGVVDWRNIVPRLEAADPCVAVAPVIDSLPVGADVLEIDPARTLGASGTAWSRAVEGQVDADDALLARDPALTPVAILEPALDPRPYSPVQGVLFRKTSGQAACR